MMSGAGMAEWNLLRLKVKQWTNDPWIPLINLIPRLRQAQTDKGRKNVHEELKPLFASWLKSPWFKLAVLDVNRFMGVMNWPTQRFFSFLEKGPWARGDWNDHVRALGDLAPLTCPVLAIWGEDDRFLPPSRSAATLKHLLANQIQQLTTEVIPNCSHILSRNGTTDFHPDYLSILSTWFNKIYLK